MNGETITIQNGATFPVTISHPHFSMTVPPQETVTIRREQLQDNPVVYCRHATVRNVEVRENRGFMCKKNGRRQFYVNEHETTISMITAFSLDGLSELKLKSESVSVGLFAIKQLSLLRISGEADVQSVIRRYLFPDSRSKQLCLKRMRRCMWLLPLALLFLCGIGCLFQADMHWIEKATVLFFCLGTPLVIFQEIYYSFAAKKWDVFEE